MMKQIDLECVELTKIFRQSEKGFIALLNSIRDGCYSQSDLTRLNERVVRSESDDGEITLTTTNDRAAQINGSRLNALQGPAFQYEATVTGKFDESAYPNDFRIALKNGAQVMLIRNDTNKRWVNGSIGHIEALSEYSIRVSVEGKVHDVPRVKWEKIQYVYDEETKRIQPEVVGTFEQYPLKLAWAITIHKSQGQTFDNVTIELGDGAFAHGQVYVALSRCTSFAGMRLGRPIATSDVIFDRRVLEFRKRWKSPTRQSEVASTLTAD
jgi:hypothetical protein